jgi:hypothetical protein
MARRLSGQAAQVDGLRAGDPVRVTLPVEAASISRRDHSGSQATIEGGRLSKQQWIGWRDLSNGGIP